MTSNKLPEHISLEAVRLYESGFSVSQVAAKTGIGKTSVLRATKAHGVASRKSLSYAHHPCRKRELPLDEIRSQYEAGETVAALAKKYGVGFGTMQRRLKESCATMRPNSWDKFHHLSDDWAKLYINMKMPMEIIAAQGAGADYATIRRYLINAGVKMRPSNVIQRHPYNSPVAGLITVRGAWELAYAKVLDFWTKEQVIAGWSYESEKVPLIESGKWYLPDFVVIPKTGKPRFHEVKGYLWQKSAAKIAEVRSNGIPIVLITGRILACLCAHYRIPFATRYLIPTNLTPPHHSLTKRLV